MSEGKTEAKVCFVVSEIGDEGTETRVRADQVLKHIITPVAKECGYNDVLRADDIAKPGMITPDIIAHLYSDPLVIADLTGRNPNVYYEVAVRQALKKPLVMLIAIGERLPFDVADSRTIKFDHHDLDSVGRCKESLAQQIKAVEKDPDLVDSPISIGLDLLQLRSQTDPASKINADLMAMMVKQTEAFGELSRSVQNLALQQRQQQVAVPRLSALEMLGVPTVTISPPVDSEAAEKIVREMVRKQVEELNVLRCSKCGSTENLRIGEPKKFNDRISHHDQICGRCGATVRQYHVINSDQSKKEWSCPEKCEFHMSLQK